VITNIFFLDMFSHTLWSANQPANHLKIASSIVADNSFDGCKTKIKNQDNKAQLAPTAPVVGQAVATIRYCAFCNSGWARSRR
jgi:hypothetical protein